MIYIISCTSYFHCCWLLFVRHLTISPEFSAFLIQGLSAQAALACTFSELFFNSDHNRRTPEIEKRVTTFCLVGTYIYYQSLYKERIYEIVLPSKWRMYLRASPSAAHLPKASDTLVKRSGPFVLINRINGLSPRCSL